MVKVSVDKGAESYVDEWVPVTTEVVGTLSSVTKYVMD